MKKIKSGKAVALALTTIASLNACSSKVTFKGMQSAYQKASECTSNCPIVDPVAPPLTPPTTSPVNPLPTQPVVQPVVQPSPPPVNPPVTPSGPVLKAMQENYQAPAGNAKADVVFIVDTTSLMAKTVVDMPNRLGDILSSWTSIDWQAGVMNADPVIGNFRASEGKLIKINSYPSGLATPHLLLKSNPYADYMLDQTMNYAGHMWPGNYCDYAPFCQWGSSQPLGQIVQLINNKSAPENAGFFRPGAYLVPIVISAQDDKSSVSGAQVMQAFNASLGTTMAGLRAFSLVVQPGDSDCLTQYQSIFKMGAGGEYGQNLSAFAKASGGGSASVCSSSFMNQLTGIVDSLAPQIKTVALAQEPIANSLTIDFAKPYRGTWSVSGKTITFSAALPAMESLNIHYNYVSAP